MTRRRIIEGRWKCTSCGKESILGREKRCPACGSPREVDETAFDFGPRAATGAAVGAAVSDAEGLQQAQAGADWFCASCGAGNQGDQQQCIRCGAQRDDPVESAEPLAAASPPRARTRSLAASALGLVFVAALGGCSALCCGGFLWSAKSREVDGEVIARQWSRSITLETFAPQAATGWRDELTEQAPRMPVNGTGEEAGLRIGTCEKKQRGTRKVPEGTERVCREKTRSVPCGEEERCTSREVSSPCGTKEECEIKDLGNGFAEEVCQDVTVYCEKEVTDCHEVTVYCDERYTDCKDETRYRSEPVMADWCQYETWAWQVAETLDAAGQGDDEPAWPQVRPSERQRTARTESYSVTVGWGEGMQHELTELDASSYARWPMGQPARLRVTNIDAVLECEPR